MKRKIFERVEELFNKCLKQLTGISVIDVDWNGWNNFRGRGDYVFKYNGLIILMEGNHAEYRGGVKKYSERVDKVIILDKDLKRIVKVARRWGQVSEGPGERYFGGGGGAYCRDFDHMHMRIYSLIFMRKLAPLFQPDGEFECSRQLHKTVAKSTGLVNRCDDLWYHLYDAAKKLGEPREDNKYWLLLEKYAGEQYETPPWSR